MKVANVKLVKKCSIGEGGGGGRDAPNSHKNTNVYLLSISLQQRSY